MAKTTTTLSGIPLDLVSPIYDKAYDAATGFTAHTAILHVSGNGDNSDGETWETAYNDPKTALDAASTDANECTLILIAPKATAYNIATTGDPTWSGNYDIRSSHRIWAAITNSGTGTPTSVMNFTGKASITDLAIFTAGSVNGVSFTADGWRVRRCGFNSTGLGGAATSLHIDGDGGQTKGGILDDCEFLGNATYTTAIHIENSTINQINDANVHDCLVGMLFDGTAPDLNRIHNLDIGDCALGLDINTGAEQHFDGVSFHHNTRNVDDEVGSHSWRNIAGNFPITTVPDDVVGTTVTAGAGAAWSAGEQEIIAAGDNPFRIVGSTLDPVAAERYRVRLKDGTTYFDDLTAEGGNPAAKVAAQAPSGTEFIFNKGTAITASAKSASGSNEVKVSLQIQII